MKKVFTILFSTVIIFSVTGNAKAAVLKFDDVAVNPSVLIQDGYEGFNWDNLYIFNKDYSNSPGYENGIVSQKNAASNLSGLTASISGQLFDFHNARFTAASSDNLQINIVGLLNGVERYTETITVDNKSPYDFVAQFKGIDKLTFNTIQNSIFVMDNLTYNIATPAPVPEPSSIILGLMSLGGMFGLKKRKTVVQTSK